MKNSKQCGSEVNDSQLIPLLSLAGQAKPVLKKHSARILLLKPPYFTPWTPPLGIAILKSFLSRYGYAVTCFDFNIDPDLWGMHHKYFSALERYDRTILNDGYSKLWWILNAHTLAFVNGGSRAEIADMLDTVVPFYGIRMNRAVCGGLLSLVENYFLRLEKITDGIDLGQYDVVGTSTYTTSLGSSLWLLRRAKEHSIAIKTVIGGGVFADDLALGSENLEILLREYQFIDHAVLGEGEMLFLQLLNGTLASKRLISLADLKGAGLHMKDVPAPDFSDLNLENYYHLTIEGARSCPFQCSFCSETIQWGEYRKKPIELLAEQVVELSRKHGIREFFMGDSLMNPYLIPFAAELRKRQANVLYDGYLRADRPVTHRKFVSEWAASGLFRVRLGIESAAVNVLTAMDKKTTPEVIAEVLKTLATMGIRTTTYWIVGFAGETEEDFEQTCEFIRQNHQYIYELEAHPYYYYPYGQVGSRFHECKELYPEKVTALTRFKVWDIVDANPDRPVRYERLKRICALASELGIPNIYTMAERYAAEDRWLRLHPAAIEVYSGTDAGRQPAEFVAEAPMLSNAIGPEMGQVVAFHCTVSKPLNREFLIDAFSKLFDYHQILRMRFVGNRYLWRGDDDHGYPIAIRDIDCISDKACCDVCAGMAADGNLPIGLGLVSNGESTELLFCGHRRILDPDSLLYLTEDLFRIYEQLANGRKILLPVTGMSFSQAASVLQETSGIPRLQQETECVLGLQQEFSISLDHSLITPELLAGIVRSASSAAAAAGLSNFAVLVGPRAFDLDLAGVTGNLSRIVLCPVHRKIADLGEQIEAWETNLRRDLTLETVSGDLSSARVLVNLEYLLKTPWLGGDAWKPQGFLVNPAQQSNRFDIELVLLTAPGKLQIKVLRQTNAAGDEIAAQIAPVFLSEINAVVDYCQRVKDAERFWCAEFGPPYKEAQETPTVGAAEGLEALSTVDCGLEELDCGTKQAPIDFALLLTAYVTVLARSAGHDYIDVAIKHPSASAELLPLRLVVGSQATFEQVRASVEESLSAALKHGQYSKGVLRRFTSPDIVRAGLLVISERDQLAEILHSVLETGLEMALVFDSCQAPRLRLVYRTSIGQEHAASVVSCLHTLLRSVADNEDRQLEELFLVPEISTAISMEMPELELEAEFQF